MVVLTPDLMKCAARYLGLSQPQWPQVIALQGNTFGVFETHVTTRSVTENPEDGPKLVMLQAELKALQEMTRDEIVEQRKRYEDERDIYVTQQLSVVAKLLQKVGDPFKNVQKEEQVLRDQYDWAFEAKRPMTLEEHAYALRNVRIDIAAIRIRDEVVTRQYQGQTFLDLSRRSAEPFQWEDMGKKADPFRFKTLCELTFNSEDQTQYVNKQLGLQGKVINAEHTIVLTKDLTLEEIVTS